jgi:hypothetical protein
MADPKLISVAEWRKRFVPPPSRTTVWRWIREGKIVPAPQKYGRSYYLTDDATFCVNLHQPNADD